MNSVINSQIKVLVVGIKWPPETFIQRKLHGLSQNGISVTVATTCPLGSAKFILEGVGLIRLPHWSDPLVLNILQCFLSGTSLLVRKPKRWSAVARSIQKHSRSLSKLTFARLRSYLPLANLHPDIVHFEWNSAAIEYLPLFDALRIPTVVSCRGAEINVVPHNPERNALREGLRSTFRRAAAVHCVSEAIKQEATQYGLDPEKAFVIRPAVDPDLFRPFDVCRSESDTLRVVTTGSLIWRKGHEYSLLAIRNLIDNGIPADFDIIGDGPERQRILYTIHDLNLVDRVHLHGHLTPTQVRDLVSQSDVFLLSSLSEGISNAVLEAMACGLPIVTTDCGGMREVVTHGVEGLVVPMRDSEALCVALAKLAVNRGMKQQMGHFARERILRDFTLKHQIKQFIGLYRAVLGVHAI